MATLPGRCVNEMFCSLAASGQIVRVPADARFVCPQCGKALVGPNVPFRSQLGRGRAAAAISIIMTIIGFIAGMVLGGVFVWPVEPVMVPVTMIRLKPPPAMVSVPTLVVPPPGIVSVTRPRRPLGRTPEAAPQDAAGP